jgi:hypothetical protein
MSINVIELGAGRFVINHGYFGNKAALFIEPASMPGEIGEGASKSGLRKTECVPGGTVITFENLACADVLRDETEAAYKRIGTKR